MKIQFTLANVMAALTLFISINVIASDLDDSKKPSNLTITLILNSQPSHNNFTRYVKFKNIAGRTKSVAVSFTKSSYLNYEGVVTASGLTTLESMAENNNRSYWDKMYFQNKGGSTALDINQFFIYVEYDQTCCGREQVAQIGYMSSQYLDSGSDSFYIAAYTGRRLYAQDYLGINYSEFRSFPSVARYMIYDIGKSGSSDASDSLSSSNPKYASSGSSLCSETISWYYYEYGVSISNQYLPWLTYNFKNIESHADMHDQFKYAGRLYCYHAGYKEWIKKDISYNWVLSDSYHPQAGDFLDRRDSDGDSSNGDDGHAMMLMDWDENTGIAQTLDGPWNINFRPVNVESSEVSGSRDYCVGRIPAND
ncbi:MAG: hypothetical protein HOE90_17895 [Bacteriovoracaceae bacterium]|jgi:hypothetical protein|nr:hypothetical protein [Bacteriovoracaceae bacterium]